MKKIRISLLSTFLVIVFCAVSGTLVSADTKIKFNKKNFPNEFLRQVIYDEVDVNEDGYLSKNEINSTEELVIDLLKLGEKHEDAGIEWGTKYSKEEWEKYCIFDCKGLKHFKNLKTLYISVYDDYYGLGIDCRIKNLNEINKLTKLENLTLKEDKVTTKLDLRKLKNLKKINITYIDLKKVNISGLKKLKEVYISSNKLSKVNLKTNKKLKSLFISSDSLKKINLSKNKELKYLCLDTKNLKNINIKSNAKINNLTLDGVFKKLDLQKNTKLKKMYIYSTKLEKVVFPKENKIKWIYLDKTPIKKINVTRLNPNSLTVLNLPQTNMEKLDISKLTSLKMLRVPDSTKVKKAEGQKARVVRCGETYSEYITKD